MRNLAYLTFGCIVVSLAILTTYFLPNVDDDYYNQCVKHCRPITDTTGCSINTSYEASFSDCKVTFYEVWSSSDCNDQFLFSNDGGQTWTPALPGVPVQQNGVSQCDIVIKSSDSQETVYEIKQPIECGCGECVPSNNQQYQLISNFLENPTASYLSFDDCCCKDYVFSIDGIQISSILVSLKLHVDYLNNISYSISSVDDTNKVIYLVKQ